MQVLQLVPTWVDLEAEDALELLGSNYAVPPIRHLALRSLAKLPDAELLCFLMPLSVALRYDVTDRETPPAAAATGTPAALAADTGGGASDGRACSRPSTPDARAGSGEGENDSNRVPPSPQLVPPSCAASGTGPAGGGGGGKGDADSDAARNGPGAGGVGGNDRHGSSCGGGEEVEGGQKAEEEEKEGVGVGSLASFLIARSCVNARIATALFWHLSVERSCGGEPLMMCLCVRARSYACVFTRARGFLCVSVE